MRHPDNFVGRIPREIRSLPKNPTLEDSAYPNDEVGTRPNPDENDEIVEIKEGDAISDPTSDGWVKFSYFLSPETVPDYPYHSVVIESPDTRNIDVASIKNTRIIWLLIRNRIGTPQNPPGVSPDVSLNAFDQKGNMVGWNSTDGKYVAEIPGVRVDELSGPQPNREWITTPSNKSIRYELDTSAVQDWIEYIEENTSQTIEDEDISANITFQMDSHTNKTELNFDTGELENSMSMERTVSVNPTTEETISLGASAITDFDPDTLNKQDEGRWVNVTLKVPHEEIKVSDIDLTTVKLNQRVEPEMDEKFGFVRNPVENETFKAKFPRDEVADILDTGESVTVFITAETTKGELLTGKDKIRVIDRGRGVCPPGERVGPPDEVPGVGPDDGPGERVGPPDEVPSQANVSGCPSEEEGDSSEEEDDQIRRDRGRGDDSDMGTRHDRGRGDNYKRGGRGIPEGSRTRGR